MWRYAILMVVCGAAGCGKADPREQQDGPSGESRSKSAPSANAQAITMKEFALEHAKNPKVSTPRTIVLTGTVNMTNIGGEGTVLFRAPAKQDIRVFGFFKKDDWKKINEELTSAIVAGGSVQVTFRCQYSSNGDRELVHLKQCELLDLKTVDRDE